MTKAERQHTFTRSAKLVVALAAMLAAPQVFADDSRLQSPRWSFELKGGKFEPALDDYETFFDAKDTDYAAVAFAYRHSHWLEFGGEIGYSSDNGVGELPINQQQAGSTVYRLMPVHAFVNLRGDYSENQLFVPYGGVGVVAALYQQKVEGQSNRDGYSELGYSARAGLALSFNRLDPRLARTTATRGALKNTYAFLEAQFFDVQEDGIDLGGAIYMLGLRFEFDHRSDEQRGKIPTD